VHAVLRETDFVRAVRDAGARVFRVGGCVRDRFRNAEAKDVDYVLTGMAEENFCAIFPRAEKIGKYMDCATNESPSFRYFWQELQKRLLAC